MLDYGSGNVHSAAKALEAAGRRRRADGRPRSRARDADGLVVPGVGAFAAVMAGLDAVRGGELIERRLAGGRPVLGICVGMQVLFERGVERGVDTEGLGEWPGVVDELDAPVLPHIGWNTVEAPARLGAVRRHRATSASTSSTPTRAQQWTLEAQRAVRRRPRSPGREHGERFLAAVENGPLSATQFHPEKSGEAGIRLLGNWLAARCATLRTRPYRRLVRGDLPRRKPR